MDDLTENFFLVLSRIVKTDTLQAWITPFLTIGWWQLLLCFIACSIVMITRLNAVEKNGFEGTLIGTLIMPYFSGFPNLCFAYLLIKNGPYNSISNGSVVLENCLVNNITNLTIVLAVPAVFWGLNLFNTENKKENTSRINHLSLLLSLLALIFFSLSVFFVSKDEKISSTDGMLLVGIFIFWQLFHVFDVLKNNTRQARKIKKRLFFDFFIIMICAWGIFSSIDLLIQWVYSHGKGLFSSANMGFLSGILMVVPNAFLAVYYAAAKRPEIAYSSQIGDCHICIPLCIGIFAIYAPITVPESFEWAILMLAGVSAGHFLLTAFWGKLPRFAGVILAGLYAFFIYKEVI